MEDDEVVGRVRDTSLLLWHIGDDRGKLEWIQEK